MIALAARTVASATVPAGYYSFARNGFVVPSGDHVKYGPLTQQTVNVFPAASAGGTTVILVHGGWWHSQLREPEDVAYAQQLQAAGFAVFDMNYPETSGKRTAFPIQPDAIALCVVWVMDNASTYHADPSNIAILGGSTGGNIALLAGQRINAEHRGRIKGVVSLSSPMNLVTLANYEIEQKAKVLNGEVGNMGGYVRLAQATGAKVPTLVEGGVSEALAKESSPRFHIDKATSPRIFLTGSRGENIIPITQQREMRAAAEKAGVPVVLDEVPGNGHSFAYWPKVVGAIKAWIKGL